MLRCATVELLELSIVVAELKRATLTSCSLRQLTVSEVVSHLMSLLITVEQNADEPLNLQLCTDLILNWLLNVYDQSVTPTALPSRCALQTFTVVAGWGSQPGAQPRFYNNWECPLSCPLLSYLKSLAPVELHDKNAARPRQ